MTARNQIRPHNRLWPLKVLAGTIFIILIMVLAIVPGGQASDNQFSMQIQDKTLAEVFQDLARMSGRTIVFDKEWTDQPINIRFVNLSLEMAIAKILTNLNYVTIFDQDSIQVKIYGVVTPDKGSYQAPATEHEIIPSARPLPISTRQNDEMEEESAPEEATNAETVEAEDTEKTNEEKVPEAQEETDGDEATSPENDKDAEGGNASD
jgi:type II secretory pathway component GspD/PulD (secretin)